jgi:hypothetical protein
MCSTNGRCRVSIRRLHRWQIEFSNPVHGDQAALTLPCTTPSNAGGKLLATSPTRPVHHQPQNRWPRMVLGTLSPFYLTSELKKDTHFKIATYKWRLPCKMLGITSLLTSLTLLWLQCLNESRLSSQQREAHTRAGASR